jgi:hypothetical protein
MKEDNSTNQEKIIHVNFGRLEAIMSVVEEEIHVGIEADEIVGNPDVDHTM